MKNRFKEIEEYIRLYYQEFEQKVKMEKLLFKCMSKAEIPSELDDFIKRRDQTFSESLLSLIDSRALDDVVVYKNAGIDRKLFSKIRSNKNYKPSKMTSIALAFSLKLTLDETLDLLKKAGYTLSNSSKFDLIVRYFLDYQIYDLVELNEALYAFEEQTFDF